MITQIPDINLHTVCFAATLLLSLAILLCSVTGQDRIARKLTLLLPLGPLIMAGYITLSRGFPLRWTPLSRQFSA